MTPPSPLLVTEVDGRPATADDLRLRALDSYGHFTALQVRNGRTRGLAQQLARLDSATRELFGTGLPSERREVTLAGLSSYRAAFVTNSIGIAPVARIDGTVLPGDEALLKTVREVYEGVAWDRI
ncbi:hypothetical protein [Streptomyces sp. NPDC059092]|uniref:hypothetical protein n=1 Tax=Streptomyces sp. NPDC059092 TaxID=3346725 RepID=UPI0036830C5B